MYTENELDLFVVVDLYACHSAELCQSFIKQFIHWHSLALKSRLEMATAINTFQRNLSMRKALRYAGYSTPMSSSYA